MRTRRSAGGLLLLAAGCLTAGGSAFAAAEHIPEMRGLYWAIETATTVGYGDITPRNSLARLIAVLVMLTAIPLLAAVFALVTGHHLAGFWHKLHVQPMRDELAAMEKRLREHADARHAELRRDITRQRSGESTERLEPKERI